MQRVLARTRNRLDDGNRANGNQPALDEPDGKSCSGLTPPSSATAGGRTRQKRVASPRRSLERVVRPPAYRGASGPPELATAHRRGNEGAAAGKRVNGAGNAPEEGTGRRDDPNGNQPMLARTRHRLAIGNRGNGDRLATAKPSGKGCSGLTPPSSATEAGDARRGFQRKADRQPPFAGARC